jgi:predicted lysophospholipase L1 biosynthesis ABC-type transport system permease subunit
LNRHLFSTDSAMGALRRIVGVVADVDDERLAGQPALTFYWPIQQAGFAGRLFVRTARDPHTLVPAITRTIREIAADQPVERAATLEDVRAELLSPDRVNALVFSGFAGIALLIAVVGIAGVLAFSVSARTREFGLRLAVGCSPRALLTHVLSQGAAIAGIGIAAGAAGGFVLSRLATKFFTSVQLPGPLAVAAASVVLLGAAVVASWLPAARASRIDVIEALRSE